MVPNTVTFSYSAGCIGLMPTAIMALQYEVTLLRFNDNGSLCWRQTLPINEALLALLRYARQYPNSKTTIELRDPKLHVIPFDIDG